MPRNNAVDRADAIADDFPGASGDAGLATRDDVKVAVAEQRNRTA